MCVKQLTWSSTRLLLSRCKSSSLASSLSWGFLDAKKRNVYMVMPGFCMGKKAFAITGLLLTETKKFFYLVDRG
jgi:hypothetical protein